MSNTQFIRVAGGSAILAGIATLAATLLEENPVPAMVWIYLFSTLSTIIALSGIYLYQREAGGLLNLIGFSVALLANLLLFLPNWVIGGSVYIVGLVILGAATVRAKRFPAWVPWLWIAAPLIASVGFVVPDFSGPLFLFGGAAIALSFGGAGFRMLSAGKAV